ncbi:putative restriction endonuclease [Lausannevirus]|uniref:Putative endonuclease n=2 Tax=Lausannevirus TaxID=999883 RepID=A0A0N7G2F7_9VIRU|nr:putative restriction endonuclease [Lausannevirus]AEA07187.1 putative restriction endonuclease [Lausannevirus]ALH07000.1 putative endonuclease [Port-miou virus]
MNCETKKRGKLCGREECKPCFERSFASVENSKYLKEDQGSPLLIARSTHKKFWFECGKCGHSFEARLNSVSNGQFCPFCSNKRLCSLGGCETCLEKSFASSNKAEFWDMKEEQKKSERGFCELRKKVPVRMQKMLAQF